MGLLILSKAQMDDFSAESDLQWAFNLVETTLCRRNTMGGTDEVKYINQDQGCADADAAS